MVHCYPKQRSVIAQYTQRLPGGTAGARGPRHERSHLRSHLRRGCGRRRRWRAQGRAAEYTARRHCNPLKARQAHHSARMRTAGDALDETCRNVALLSGAQLAPRLAQLALDDGGLLRGRYGRGARERATRAQPKEARVHTDGNA